MDKGIIIALIIGVIVIGGTIMVTNKSDTPKPANVQRETQVQIKEGENVTVENGVQVITIDAKGGYTPRKSVAKAGIETVIRFNTKGTFDCSSAVRIPSLDISKTLPQSGSTDIAIGTPEAGPLQGTCGMGMYPFEVIFE